MDENQARIFYLLSDEGRKRLLLRHGDGRREQVFYGTPSDSDIELFKIDSHNRVSLDLRTAYLSGIVVGTAWHIELDENSAETSSANILWDIVPTWDDLIGFARTAAIHAARLEEEHDRLANEQTAEREAVGAAFLANPDARADQIQEKTVIVDGYHFWRNEWESDPVVKEALARAARDTEEQRAANRRTLAAYIENSGSDNQRQRLAAGLLPWQEAYDYMETELYMPLWGIPEYQRFTPEEVCKCVETGFLGEPCKPKFKSVDATELTAEEWDRLSQIKALVPNATFQLREHQADCMAFVPPMIRRGVIVKIAVDNLRFKREFALYETSSK